MQEIKIQRNKYESMTLDALLYLVKFSQNQSKTLEVWKEMLYRYFEEGRTFNLYKEINSIKGDTAQIAFATTINYELAGKSFSVPVEHSEQYIACLLSFIDYVDRKVIQNPNLSVAWKYHELSGLSSLIKNCKKAKIKDQSFVQTINQFCDKVNALRDEELAKEDESSVETKPESPAHTDIVAINNVLIAEEKHELMQEKLQPLNIAVSRMNKQQLFDNLKILDKFYPKDREKLIARAFSKYPSDYIRSYPLHALVYAVENNIDANQYNERSSISFYECMFREILCDQSWGSRFTSISRCRSEIKEIVGESEAEYRQGLYNYLRALFENAQYSSPEAKNSMFFSLYRFSDNDSKFTEMAMAHFKPVMDEILSYKNQPLSFLLNKKIKMPVLPTQFDTQDISSTEKFPSRDVTIAWDTNMRRLIISEKDSRFTKEDGDIKYLSMDVLSAHFYLRRFLSSFEFFKYNGYEQIEMIHTYCADNLLYMKEYFLDLAMFPCSVIIDKSGVEYVVENGDAWNTLFTIESVFSLVQMKLCRGSLTHQDIRALCYDVPEYYNLSRWHSFQGWFDTNEEQISKVFTEVLSLYNFAENNDFSRFFILPIYFSSFSGFHSFSEDNLRDFISKVKKERPHEFELIKGFFSQEATNHVIYEDLFDGYSDAAKMVIAASGIEVTKKHEKYGVMLERGEVVDADIAEYVKIFDFFRKNYEKRSD